MTDDSDQPPTPRQWRERIADIATRDARTALRAILGAKGFAATVVATLALGIGASVTIFSVVDHVLVRPLSYPDADRLVTLFQLGKGGNLRLVSNPTLQDWAREKVGLSGLAWIRGDGAMIDGDDGPQRAGMGFVTPGFFSVMGQRAALGRTFVAEEEVAGGADVVVLSHDLWQKSFGGDEGIIGKVLRIDSASVEVVGVMPLGFAYPPWAQAWRPIASLTGRDPVVDRRDFHVDSRAIGRLAPGVDAAHAARLLGVVQQRVAADYPGEEEWTGVRVTPLQDEVVGNVRSALLALGGAVALILLVACVNVANLAAVRGSSRGREVAIRLALGANRGQIARQLAMESGTLAVVGGAIGVVLAWRAVAWLRATAPFDLPRAQEIVLDARASAVAAGVTMLTALLFGVVPALRASVAAGGFGVLLGGRSGAGGARREARGRAALTSLQFALALLLLVGAGLLAQSYRRLLAAQLGFDAHGLLSAAVSPPNDRYGNAAAAFTLYQRVIDRLRAEPGVEEAAVVNFLPLANAGIPTRIEVPGRPVRSEDLATYVTASEAYLRTMRIPVVRGRWFSADEMRSPGDGVVISETVAKRYWPDQDPVGKPLTIFRSSQSRPEFGRAVASVVVGVVGDVRQYGVATSFDPAVYVPLAAEPWPWVSFVVRARNAGSVSPAALRKAVLDIEPRLLPVGPGIAGSFRLVESTLSASLAPRRYVLGLVGAFSACALALAVIGLYGVASYAVTRRTQEFGVRIALGATRDQIVRSVLRWGMTLAVVGCAIGMAAALGLVRFIQSLLYATPGTDPAVLVSIPIILIVVGAVAVYAPARRAASVDPIVALRSE